MGTDDSSLLSIEDHFKTRNATIARRANRLNLSYGTLKESTKIKNYITKEFLKHNDSSMNSFFIFFYQIYYIIHQNYKPILK